MRKLTTLAAFLVVCLPASVLADGKFYSSERVPPGLPYQRALIAHDGSRELLILQSKFEGEAKDFGWVVPLPSIPELASMGTSESSTLFVMLDMGSGPKVTYVGSAFLPFLILALVLTIIISAAARVGRERFTGEVPWYKFKGRASDVMIVVLIIAILSAMALPGELGVEVVSEKQVGIYDVKVIRSDSSEEIIAWLNGHSYRFKESDRKEFDRYIEQGWCFVTARINLEKAKQGKFRDRKGLVNPLVMLFETEKPVYPLSLTGTIGNKTMVLLYMFGAHKVHDNSKRFAVRFADKRRIEPISHLLSFQPEDFGKKWDFRQGYLTKLKARLTPEQMREDLLLEKAPDDEPYREHVYSW